MDIKFEWAGPDGTDDASVTKYTCWFGAVRVGGIHKYGRGEYDAWFGHNDGRHRRASMCQDIPLLAEAKAWVEAKAREWLAEVTA